MASALFMEFVDSTALSTALPTLSVAFDTDPIHLKLALTSYILALAVLAPASGWVADRFGPRRVFMLAMGVFLIASVLCGFSRTLPQLVVFRTLQGLGGALMTPVGRLIVVGSAPRDKLVSALSWFTMPALVGPLIGPPLAGLILGVADWPWIFFINVPVGLLGMLAVSRYVPELPQPHPGPFDWKGYAIAAVAIILTIGAAETLGVGLVPVHIQMGMALVAVGAIALYVAHALRMKKPVLDLRLLKLSTFRASTAGGGLVRMGLGATPFLLPLMLQVGLG
ncbi:MFS transporter, partial [Myxococcus llanfairpwllgwyngyllgogerychwyrndrobwllllantysiliogogogochensis]